MSFDYILRVVGAAALLTAARLFIPLPASMSEHLLTALLLIPLLGALAVAFMPRQWRDVIRRFSKVITRC